MIKSDKKLKNFNLYDSLTVQYIQKIKKYYLIIIF